MRISSSCFTLYNCSFQSLLARMLQDLEQGVDRSEAKLNSAMSRMRKFIRQTEGSFTLLCQLYLLADI